MLTSAIKLAIRCYQYTFGAVLPGACRFEPTCSEYALQALSVHGLARGGWLTVKRLARCHPFGRCGFDPVPDRNRRIDSKSRTVKSAGTEPDGKADVYMTGERI